MKLIVYPVTVAETLSFAWTAMKLFIDDIYRYYYREDTVVKTKSGLVKGFKIASNFDYDYYNFIGIPYAKPPIGELRFMDPQPFEATTEIINREFGRRGSMCCQQEVFTRFPIGTENCLHLSVYTRDINPQKLKPVMVWIHGGAFLFASNNKDLFNPEFLLRTDIVLISINYRLGAFGFLSFKDPSLGVPGNAGLKDQVMALKWIKENCMHFGGDPNNITIFGESAGAVSVSMHLLSEKSKNLFHKAIMMSGTANCCWAFGCDDGRPERLAKMLGWNGVGESSCFAFLKRAPAYAITKLQEDITTLEERKQFYSIPFSPVIEPYETKQCFIKKYPKDLIDTAWSKHVPVIAGICGNDGYVFCKMIEKEPQIAHKDNTKSLLLFAELDPHVESEKCRLLCEEINHYYYNQLMPNADPFITYLKILHDKGFAYPTHQLIAHRNEYQAPTYLLRFDFDSMYSLARRLYMRPLPGACHGDDLSYYFRTVSAGPDPAQGTDEWKTIERMCAIFSSFARFGNPNNKCIGLIQWDPVKIDAADNSKHNYKCLNISSDLSYIEFPDLEQIKFWDRIYEQRVKKE